jgi:glyoxylase-like metal-dependent hydrolase (beta-lactamase superfamily II)/8-oxo-dGTP pyrophosphatase MutT (NUDIX family)
VLLVRGTHPQEVFVVERSRSLRFFGGFLAFPGGKVHAVDGEILPRAEDGAPSDDQIPSDRYIAAARELFEETGVLLARKPDGAFLAASDDLASRRREFIEEPKHFGSWMKEQHLSIWKSDFLLLGNLVTPSFAPLRFDTSFFLANLPAGQEATVWPGELDQGWWSAPAEVIRRWTRGQCLVSPPSLLILEGMLNCPSEDLPRRLARLFGLHNGEQSPPVFLSPEVQVIPLKTLALPPSTHTNCYLVGRDPAYLLDPGAAEAGEQNRLKAMLEERLAAGVRLKAIVLSHHHPDHVGAAAVCSHHFGVPIWAHSWTAQALAKKMRVSGMIEPGDRLDLGSAPDGDGTWHLEAVGTPGHAPGHLVFYEPRYQLLFAGDMVSTQSSIVIVPPQGDLGVYMNSLRLIREYPCRLLLPSHGAASSRAVETIDESIAHRLKREELLTAALGPEPRTVRDLALELYKGVPEHLMRFAELQVLSGLYKLRQENKAVEAAAGDGKSWCSAS